MTPLNQMSLPTVNIFDPEFAKDPAGRSADARRESWIGKFPMGYVILDHQGMRDILTMDEQFGTPHAQIAMMMGAPGSPWGRWIASMLASTSGEQHRRLRNLVASTFTPRNANVHRPMMRDVASGLLDEWAPKGRFDFAQFVSFFPISVMCRMIGAPPALVPHIKNHLEMMGSGFDLDPSLVPAMDAAVTAMTGYVDDLLKQHRSRSRTAADANDLLDDLIAANEKGDRMSDQELYDMVILLFGAGYDTSKNLLTMIVHQLCERPNDWKRLADEAGFAARVLEEGNRFANVTTSYRVAKVDVTYRGVVIPAGTFVAVPLPLAGHDPSKFSNPETFDPDRSERGGIGFGVGAHICLGQWIARAQIEEGLPMMARRLRNLRADGPVEYRPFPGVWGLKTLPIAFDPA